MINKNLMRTPCDWLFEKVDQQHVARSNKQSVKTFEIKDRKNNLKMYLLGKQDFPRWLKKIWIYEKNQASVLFIHREQSIIKGYLQLLCNPSWRKSLKYKTMLGHKPFGKM